MALPLVASIMLSGASAHAGNGTLTICSPLDYQVVQRQTATQGTLRLKGKTAAVAEKWQYRLLGKSLSGEADEAWHDFAMPAEDGAFDLAVIAPAGGWYQLEIRGLNGGQTAVAAGVPHVGVGEVFIVAGQSNAGNYGSGKQVSRRCAL